MLFRSLYRGKFSVRVEEVHQGISSATGWLPLAWGLAFLPLAYAPYNLQRRLPDGIWIALLITALVGVEIGLAGSARKWAVRLLLGTGFLSTFLLFIGLTFNVLNPGPPL